MVLNRWETAVRYATVANGENSVDMDRRIHRHRDHGRHRAWHYLDHEQCQLDRQLGPAFRPAGDIERCLCADYVRTMLRPPEKPLGIWTRRTVRTIRTVVPADSSMFLGPAILQSCLVAPQLQSRSQGLLISPHPLGKHRQHRPNRPDRPTPRLPWSCCRTIRSDHARWWHAHRPRPPAGIPRRVSVAQPRSPARVAVPSTS